MSGRSEQIAFDIQPFTMAVVCIIKIPEEIASIRYGRMVVYRLAAQLELIAPAWLRGPVIQWLNPGLERGEITVSAASNAELGIRAATSATNDDVVRLLNEAIAIVQLELRRDDARDEPPTPHNCNVHYWSGKHPCPDCYPGLFAARVASKQP